MPQTKLNTRLFVAWKKKSFDNKTMEMKFFCLMFVERDYNPIRNRRV